MVGDLKNGANFVGKFAGGAYVDEGTQSLSGSGVIELLPYTSDYDFKVRWRDGEGAYGGHECKEHSDCCVLVDHDAEREGDGRLGCDEAKGRLMRVR
jgi:hypothetical protein